MNYKKVVLLILQENQNSKIICLSPDDLDDWIQENLPEIEIR